MRATEAFPTGSPMTKEASPIGDQTFLYGPPSPAAALRIFCLPYAGRGASVYRRWWEGSDRRVEFVPVQFPGRENRVRESLIDDLRELVESLAANIAPHTGRPYALFGHCMGASIAFELAHRLSDLTGHRPRHLVVAGCTPPHRQQAVPSARRRTDEELVTELRRLGGTPRAVLDNERLLAFALPVLRADWCVVDGYGYRPTPALDVPITVLGSTGDPDVATDELRQWDRHTNADTRVYVFPGDHFFVERFREEIRDLLVSELAVETEDVADRVPAPETVPDGPAGHDEGLATALEASRRCAFGDVDTNAWRAALRDLDAAALTAMTRAVTGHGDGNRDGIPVDGLAERLRVAPRHRRCSTAGSPPCSAEGRVVQRNGVLVATDEAGPEQADDDRVSSACAMLGYRDNLRDFFLRCNGNLPAAPRPAHRAGAVVRGRQLRSGRVGLPGQPHEPLPERGPGEAVVHHVRNRAGTAPVRVLKLGAGFGASTSDILPTLAATGVELRYVFSDVSRIFLKAARERFADYPFVEFEMIDINGGAGPSTPPVDVVLSSNVLHNAHDVGRCWRGCGG